MVYVLPITIQILTIKKKINLTSFELSVTYTGLPKNLQNLEFEKLKKNKFCKKSY